MSQQLDFIACTLEKHMCAQEAGTGCALFHSLATLNTL